MEYFLIFFKISVIYSFNKFNNDFNNYKKNTEINEKNYEEKIII